MYTMQGVKIAVLVVLLAAPCPAQEKSAFEKLPVWPADGKLAPDLRDRYVFRDASTLEIVMAFPTDPRNPSGPRTIYRWRPQNQVEPSISVRISRASDAQLKYQYTLANASGARQSIRAWSLVLASPESDVEVDHPRWGKIRMRGTSMEQAAHPSAPAGDAAYWSRRDAPELEIAPGQIATDFVVRSSYLPGFTTAYVMGGQPLATPGELPFAVGQQLVPLMKLKESSRVVITVGPRFAPGTDHRTIAADYKQGLQLLVKGGFFSDRTSFYQEASGILEACATSGTKPCSAAKQAETLGQTGSSLEKEIGSALVLALK